MSGGADRRLILVRHGKSAWDDESLSDHARPLALRGRLASALIAAWLEEIAPGTPARTLVSNSKRTIETWERMRPLWGASSETVWTPEIYEADWSDLLDAVRQRGGEAPSLALVGHNPGLADLAGALVGAPVGRMPTASAAVLTPRAPLSRWADIREGGFAVTAYAEPKSLV